MNISPFKFLDSYTKPDKEIFFGRNKEIEQLYHKVFESKLLLVYGISGTGKSSLIECGLANKFNDSDWLPINIRRGSNLNDSLNKQITQNLITEVKETATLKKKINSLYLDHFKPIYFIFDQFEELFIFGSQCEREEFEQTLKKLLESDIPCKFIFAIREEYLANVTEFEREIPSFLENRLRIEKMRTTHAKEAIEGPCSYAGIPIEKGFTEALLERLTNEKNEVELTWLQVFLDKLYRSASGEPKQFTHALLQQMGKVSDLLGSFLEEQISQSTNPDETLAILKSFVSIKGTKRQITLEEVGSYCQTMGKQLAEVDLKIELQHLVTLRILRDQDENGRYELRHDALASKIYEKITLVEKELMEVRQFIENAYANYQKRKVLLSKEDLSYLAPYEDKIIVTEQIKQYILFSKQSLLRAKKRMRIISIVVTALIFVVLTGFTFWALNERTKATIEKNKAKANNFNYLAKEVLEEDPTKALRIAEYAYSLDTTNKKIYQNIFNIYYNNSICKKIYKGHEEGIGSVCFSPDGKYILTGSGDGTARICDLNGYLLQIFKEHNDAISSICFSPDGKNVLTGSYDNTARLWDLDGNLKRVFDGHQNSIYSVCFSPDGKYILTGSKDRTARLWDLAGNLIKVFKGHENSVFSACFSPDGQNILTGSWDKTARLWDLDGKILHIFKGHDDAIYSVCFSSDGNSIITGSEDKTAKLWDMEGNLLKVFNGHEGVIFSVCFSPDGKHIITGSLDKTIRLWDLDANLLQLFKGHENAIYSICFSPDGKDILSGSLDKTARLWKIDCNLIKVYKGHEKEVHSVCFSPNGKHILTGLEDNTAQLCNIDGKLLHVYKGHKGAITSVAFSKDGKYILTGSTDSTALLWNLDGKILHVFKGHNEAISSVYFSPDGKNILTGSYDKTARLWDINGNVLQIFKGHADAIATICYSPDGKNILTGSYDNTIRLWDLNGNLLHLINGHEESIMSLCFSPDGNKIISGSYDKTARLLDRDGTCIQIFKGHQNGIYSVCFSPDGKSILTGSEDKTAILWDLDGCFKQIFKGHEELIGSVAFSPDGKSILTGSWDKTVRLWDIKQSYAVFKAKGVYPELSISEKLNYEIMDAKDVNYLTKEEDIYEAANYYKSKYISYFGTELENNNLNKAIGLYEKLMSINGEIKYGINLSQAYFLQFSSNKKDEKIIKKITILHRELSAKSGCADLIALFNYYCSYNNSSDTSFIIFSFPQKAIEIGEKLISSNKLDNSESKELAIGLSNLSYTLLMNSHFELGLNAILLSIQVDKNCKIAYTNLPLAYLLNNQYSNAENIYMNWKDSIYNGGTFKDAFLADIKDFENAGITNAEFGKVKELLNGKL